VHIVAIARSIAIVAAPRDRVVTFRGLAGKPDACIEDTFFLDQRE
jgi:hypothetical protein